MPLHAARQIITWLESRHSAPWRGSAFMRALDQVAAATPADLPPWEPNTNLVFRYMDTVDATSYHAALLELQDLYRKEILHDLAASLPPRTKGTH